MTALTDRQRQIEYIENLAAEFDWFSDDPDAPVQDRVDYYCEEFRTDLPDWFDERDKALLVKFVQWRRTCTH